MKKENVFFMIMVVVSLFMFTGTVFAEEKVCTATQLAELRDLASNVKVTYAPTSVIIDLPTPDIETGAHSYTARYIDIKVFNLSSKLYVEASNNKQWSKVATFNDLSSDGTLTFRQEMINKKVNYEFVIKSTEYGCNNEVLRRIKLTLPIYNRYSELDICTDIPDYYLCQEFVTTPVDGSTFYDRVDAYKAKLLEQGDSKEENNTSGINKTFANAAKYKYLIVGVIVALGIVITIVIIKRKENTL